MVSVLFFELGDLDMECFFHIHDRGSQILVLLLSPQEGAAELDVTFGVKDRTGMMVLGRLADLDPRLGGVVSDDMFQSSDFLLNKYS